MRWPQRTSCWYSGHTACPPFTDSISGRLSWPGVKTACSAPCRLQQHQLRNVVEAGFQGQHRAVAHVLRVLVLGEDTLGRR